MADEEKPPEYVKLTPEQMQMLAAFNIGGPEFTIKEQVPIEDEVVQRWTSIPVDQTVAVVLTRGDLDRLYFSLTQMSAALTSVQQTLRFMSFSDNEAAGVSFQKGNELIQSADGNFRLFFKAIMSKANSNG